MCNIFSFKIMLILNYIQNKSINFFYLHRKKKKVLISNHPQSTFFRKYNLLEFTELLLAVLVNLNHSILNRQRCNINLKSSSRSSLGNEYLIIHSLVYTIPVRKDNIAVNSIRSNHSENESPMQNRSHC